MHRVHPIAGQISAAEQYQAYLERMRAARMAEKNEKMRREIRQRTVSDHAERERQSREEPQKNPNPNDDDGSEDGENPSPGPGPRYA